jgi:hypothetical protein
MKLQSLQPLSRIILRILLPLIALTPLFAQEISSSPTSLKFQNTYISKASGSQVLTISKVASGTVNITSIGFDCSGFGIASGIAPFSLTSGQLITHYSIFFQPGAAQSYNCNFLITLKDKSQLKIPLTGKGLATTAASSVTPTSLTFSDQSLGKTSAAQTVTIKNAGGASMKLTAITLSHPSFTVSSVKLPATINKGASLSLQVSYTPSHEVLENGAIDFTYDSIPDSGVSLVGNGIASSSLAIATLATLPQATKGSAYQATLTPSAGTGPFTWKVASGSALPKGLSLSSAGVISGTLNSSVATGSSTFSIQVTDSKNKTSTTKFTLGVYANLGDNCNDISFSVPNTSAPMIAINDLGTGTYQGSEGGLYPDGSNDRPASHDADGVGIAQTIQPLDSTGNPDASGKEVLLAIGESTAQNEFNFFLPIANADPTKNPSVVLVNGAQGGATPQNFKTSTSNYWSTVLNDYLPQNNVTAQQVVAVWIEDTDGIASGTFPSDMTNLRSEYETMMQTMLTLFPNLKLVYFSSRVYGGYSNGIGKPSNPEPYAYEVGFAVKWAIQDQINGKSTLNYDANKGAVVAPWMSWGPYYWSNGMLGRNDGTVWDCEDFSPDGTHPSGTFGQGKVAMQLLNFLKTDDTTTPWYLTH